MKRPITPKQGTLIKAEHLRSHAEAIQWLYEQIKNKPRRLISESGLASPITCPFGELEVSTDDPPVTAIRGGLMTCGDKNFNVPKRDLVLSTPGQWLVQISLSGVTAATDDDDEIFLPGVTTATGTPAWANVAYTGSESYGSTTNPTSPAAPTGTIIVGIGLLTIADGAARFVPTGCGTIRVGQCAGILTHSRG